MSPLVLPTTLAIGFTISAAVSVNLPKYVNKLNPNIAKIKIINPYLINEFHLKLFTPSLATFVTLSTPLTGDLVILLIVSGRIFVNLVCDIIL